MSPTTKEPFVPAAREFEERFFDMDWQAYSHGVPSAIGWPTAQWEAVQANASMARAATRIIERRWFPRKEGSTPKVAPELSEGCSFFLSSTKR